MPPADAHALDRAWIGPIVPVRRFASINEQITAITLHPPYRRNWWIGILLSLALIGLLVVVDRLAVHPRGRRLGHQHPGQLEPCDHQLRLVDRDRHRRHADLGAAAGARRAWRNSLNRFAEAMTVFAVICAGHLPDHPPRPAVLLPLAVPLSQRAGRLAAVQEPAGVGHVRRPDLPDRSRYCSGTWA